MVALYQVGLVRHLPDPPLGLFDSDRVDAAGEAYVLGHTPDALVGVASYGLTAALAAMGGQDRASRQPWIPLLAAAKVAADAVSAAELTVEQLARHRRLCFWCTLAAVLSFASVPQTLPEAAEALGQLRGQPRRG